MASGGRSTSTVPKQVALKQLVSSLRCFVCTKLPQNTHICPSCSEMYCYGCINSWLTGSGGGRRGATRKDRCAKCQASLRLDQLIKMHCFESLEKVQVDFARLRAVDAGGHGDGQGSSSSSTATGQQQSTGSATNGSFDEFETHSESQQISIGRQEPVEGLPPAVQGTFTLRNVHRCRLQWVCSERVVDSFGFVWRMKVAPKGERNQNSIDVYVEMLTGEVGFYEIMLELNNVNQIAYLIKSEADIETMVGRADFLDKGCLPRGKVDLKFRYTIRPASFQAKVQIQKRLLYKHEQHVEKLKGDSDVFSYVIPDYAYADLDDPAFEEYNDQLRSEWRFGIHGTNNFAEFQMILSDGLAGMYEVVLTMTHPTPGCEKRLRYEKRNFQLNQKNLFNFGIRWDQLEEYGYVENGGNRGVTIELSIRPIQVDLKRVQDRFASEFTDDDDDGDEDDDYGDEDDDDDDDDDYNPFSSNRHDWFHEGDDSDEDDSYYGYAF